MLWLFQALIRMWNPLKAIPTSKMDEMQTFVMAAGGPEAVLSKVGHQTGKDLI